MGTQIKTKHRLSEKKDDVVFKAIDEEKIKYGNLACL